jgi:hypothetical protein
MHHATDQARARPPELLLPRTGKAVYAEEGGIQAETFRGGWHQEVPLDPLNLAPAAGSLGRLHQPGGR